MPKYMLHGNYTATGAAGVLKDGGSGREKAVKDLVESVGGSLDTIYWALGADDFYLTVTLPDSHAAAALSIAVAATGTVRGTTSELMTAADLDDVISRRVSYRAPGA